MDVSGNSLDMGTQEAVVPALNDSAPGLALYHVVEDGANLILRSWKPTDVDQEDQEVRYQQRGAITGSILGVLTFLAGLALLGLVFKLAQQMFTTDPATLFGVNNGKTLDITKTVAIFMAVVIRVLLLVVMAIIGGVVTNRGIHLYTGSRQGQKAFIISEKLLRGGKKKKRQQAVVEDHAEEV